MYQHNVYAKGSKFYSFKKVFLRQTEDNIAVAVDCIGVEFLFAGDGRDGSAVLRDGSCELHVLQQGLHGRVWHEVPA